MNSFSPPTLNFLHFICSILAARNCWMTTTSPSIFETISSSMPVRRGVLLTGGLWWDLLAQGQAFISTPWGRVLGMLSLKDTKGKKRFLSSVGRGGSMQVFFFFDSSYFIKKRKKVIFVKKNYYVKFIYIFVKNKIM